MTLAKRAVSELLECTPPKAAIPGFCRLRGKPLFVPVGEHGDHKEYQTHEILRLTSEASVMLPILIICWYHILEDGFWVWVMTIEEVDV